MKTLRLMRKLPTHRKTLDPQIRNERGAAGRPAAPLLSLPVGKPARINCHALRINTHAQALVEILLLSCAAMKSVENMSIVEGIVLPHDHPSFRRACRINGHASDRLSRRCTHKRSRSCENPYRSTRVAPDAKAMIRLLSASSAPGAVRARWRPPSGRSRKVRALSGLR